MTERAELIKLANRRIGEIKPKGKASQLQPWKADRLETIKDILNSSLSLCVGCAALIIIVKPDGVDLSCRKNHEPNPITLWKSRASLISKPECNDFERLAE